MDANARRRVVARLIDAAAQPMSATALAVEMGVSRQVIVGDVALLRAEGCQIVSTARGYLGGDKMLGGRFVGRLACRHDDASTKSELYAMVDLGGHVLDVAVEHAIYGELTGQLGLMCRADVDDFCDRLSEKTSLPLSALTGGIHLHTLSCADRAAFERIKAELGRRGFLVPQQDNA